MFQIQNLVRLFILSIIKELDLFLLDSNSEKEAQVEWLRRALESNPNRWTIVTFHHPVFSPGADRDNPEIRKLWKPLLDEFKS
ncbi:MAG: hypothetical protein CM15mP51_01740 [Porticoccaceae bacterium]|nr:MAG: hypothetical protein CM15mP51_01740 [Porticoccaceae bacterium]